VSEDFERFDLLVAMDRSNQHERLLMAGDEAERGKVRLLREFDPASFARGDLDVPDPYYGATGGFDEVFWNGYEDVDYCLKVRERGLRVVYEPKARLIHFESQSGVQRFRKSLWNTETLGRRWRGKVEFDGIKKTFRRGYTRRATATAHGGTDWTLMPSPATTAIVHGSEPPRGRDVFLRMLRCNDAPIADVTWAIGRDAISVARDILEMRDVSSRQDEASREDDSGDHGVTQFTRAALQFSRGH